MAETKVTTNEFDVEAIQIILTSNTAASTTPATVAFNATDLSIGTRLTRSTSTVVIGTGVSYVRVSYTVMIDSGATAPYLYTRIKKNSTEVSQAIDASTSQFKSTAETKVVPVTSGDVLSIVHDIGGSGSATIRGNANTGSFMLVEVVK